MAQTAAVQRHVVTNWNLTENSAPQFVVHANSIEQVCAAVKDPKFVSPVLAVGSIHSVNKCITNTGTILNVSGLNTIVGVEGNGVRVQAGVKLADLHDYLAKQDLEISFSPEIGDATVGSLAVCTSKDSSIDGPGYLAGLLIEVTYVNEVGKLVTLVKPKHPQEMAAFICSYGMMGIVVELVLEVRKRVAVTTYLSAYPAKSGQRAAAHLAKVYAMYDTLFAILVPGREYVYIEARNKSSKAANALLVKNLVLSYVSTAGWNNIMKLIIVKNKYKSFLTGNPMGRKMSRLMGTGKPPIVHYRRDFVNRYPEVEAGTRRLDFSFIEFQDMSKFEAIVAECWDLHHDFKARTGFAPSGYGIYFVNRNWAQQRDPTAPRKPSGNFSGQPGTSFMLDPITGHCDDARWAIFNKEYTAWAVSRGAIPSLSQTKGLQPGQVELPAELTRERFLTPYYAAFVGRAVAADARKVSAAAPLQMTDSAYMESDTLLVQKDIAGVKRIAINLTASCATVQV